MQGYGGQFGGIPPQVLQAMRQRMMQNGGMGNPVMQQRQQMAQRPPMQQPMQQRPPMQGGGSPPIMPQQPTQFGQLPPQGLQPVPKLANQGMMTAGMGMAPGGVQSGYKMY